MEGERILKHILQGDTPQLQSLKNYLAPLGKILDSNLVNCVGKKAEECEQIIGKYGMYCLKLVRYCIEALSKTEKPINGQDSLVKEECFKCSKLGADMLSKLVTSGISLPSNLSISAMVKLLFHLIINSLKEVRHTLLLHFTRCLVNITRRGLELGEASKDAKSICKQTSDHLWNAAIKLEHSNSLEKRKKAVMTLSLRENSLDLLTVTETDLLLVIERGLTAARQFQVSVAEACESEDQLRAFLFALLRKAVALINVGTCHMNDTLKDGVYNLLEELCIHCCKATVNTSRYCELLDLFSLLIEKDTDNYVAAKRRFRVTQILIQMLRCALCLRLKRGKKIAKFSDDMKWDALHKRLANVTVLLKHLDSNIYVESQIVQVVDYLRSACMLFNSKTDDAVKSNSEIKVPDEMLSALVNMFLVCFNILGTISKSKKRVSSQLISDGKSSMTIVQLRLSILYLVSSLVLKRSSEGLAKSLQNGRKVSITFDYVSCIMEAKTMTDNVVEKVPAIIEHYRCIATDAFNVGLFFYKIRQFNDATSLARLSCEAADTWRSKRNGAGGILQALLFKKYELLSECLEKQGQWKESLRAMTRCCQLYALANEGFAETGPIDDKALEYVDKWTSRKHRAIKQLGERNDTKCCLYDGWQQLNAGSSNGKEVCTLLKMELHSCRKKGYCTSFQEIVIIDKLVDIFTESDDHLGVCWGKLEKVKLTYEEKGTNADERQCLSICEEIIADLAVQQHQSSIAVKDLLASSYFWCFILQYSWAMKQSEGGYSKEFQDEEPLEPIEDEEPLEVIQHIDKVYSLNLSPDFLLSLHNAVKTWTEMLDMAASNGKIDVVSSRDVCWNLQIASSVYGFLNMPLVRIHTLSVLVAFSRAVGGDENLQTMVVADSCAVQIFCEEGNLHCAELLVKRCEEVLVVLGENCQPETSFVFRIAKSHLLLLKEMYDDGWKLLKDILDDINVSKKPIFQLVLLKAKLLCSKYLSLPACSSNGLLEEDYTHVEFLYDSLRHAKSLVEHFIGEVAGVSKLKEGRGILLSHWSVLNELSCCLMDIGKVFLLQGAVREGKRYLKDGRNIARQYSSPIRFSEFALQLAELNLLTDNLDASEANLKPVFHFFKPDASLCDTVNKAESFELPSEFVDSPFKNYDEISVFRLYALFLVSFCQYTRMGGNSSDVKTIIVSLRVLRQNSIERYQPSLVCLQRVLGVTCGERSCQNNDASLPSTGRRKAKTKVKKGKTDTKSNEKNNYPELPCEKAQVASISLIETGLKLHALESDFALSEGDYTTLMSSVKEGLKLLQWAQQFAKNLFLVDLVSSSLLHFLRGVAHVLSSKCGFDSWRVAGCSSLTVDHGRNIEDISEEISCLEISPTVHDAKVSECREKNEDSNEGDSPFLEQMLLKECRWEDLDFNDDRQRTVEVKIRKSERSSKCNAIKYVGSEKPSKRTTTRTRKKLSKTNEVAEEVGPSCDDVKTMVRIACEEMDAEKDSKDLRKGSRSAKKDSVKDDGVLARRSTRTKQDIRNKNKSSSMNGDAVSENHQTEVSVVTEDGLPRRGRTAKKKDSKKTSSVLEEHEEDVRRRLHVESESTEQDEEILKALQCFHLSLKYLHPYYNPVLLTRVCHALVLCYGLTSPAMAALYQNLSMAATLRHQAMHSSNKKIRQIKKELTDEEIEGGNRDDLVKLFDSATLDNSNSVNLHKLLQLRTIKNVVGFKVSNDEIQERFNHFMDLLPKDLTVCTLSVLPSNENVKNLLVSRLRKNKKPLVLKWTLPKDEDENDEDENDEMEDECRFDDSVVRDLSTIFRQDIISDFSKIIRNNAQSMKLESKQKWWENRKKIDSQLERFVKRLEDSWFGKWRGIMSGCVLGEENVSQLKSAVAALQIKALEIFGAPVENEQLLEVLIEWYSYLKSSEVTCALAELTGTKSNSAQVTKFFRVFKQFVNANVESCYTVSKGPIVLILDKAIQHLPFESMPILRDEDVSRMPSLDFVTSHLSLQRIETPSSLDILTTGVDPSKTFYVLNPGSDLQRTEECFREWFSSEKGWSGVVGRPPSPVEFKEALSSNHLFLYIGHGNGRKFLSGDDVQKLHCQAVAVLMGCSSGKLIVQGNCDPTGMVLNYMLSGCPAVVGNLWDVTDVDIDVFCDALLKKWLDEDSNLSLSKCVSQCRSTCKLKYLNGSAPVVYGMPVHTRKKY